MKVSHTVCKKNKCSHYNEEEKKCTFDDCIFRVEEIVVKEERVDDAEFNLLLMKCAGATAIILLVMLMILKKAGFI